MWVYFECPSVTNLRSPLDFAYQNMLGVTLQTELEFIFELNLSSNDTAFNPDVQQDSLDCMVYQTELEFISELNLSSNDTASNPGV